MIKRNSLFATRNLLRQGIPQHFALTQVSYADWTYKVTEVSSQNTAGNKQAGGKYVIVVIDATNNANAARQPGGG